LLAHFTEDPTLVSAFHNGEDIHQKTADLIGKKLGGEFPRSHGKLLNFSLIYGKTAFGFAKDWNCSVQEAENIIETYFIQFPRVKEWMKDTILQTKLRKSWGKSIAGLPLYICAKGKDGEVMGDINSPVQWIREAAERCAVNYPIQSSSQDIIKKAMVEINNKYKSVYPVLFVHDEMVFELAEGDLKWCIDNDITDIMQNAWKLRVPLKVSWHIADCWEK